MSIKVPAFFSHVKDNLPVWGNLSSGGLTAGRERGIPSLEVPVRPGDVVRWLRVQQGFGSQQALAKRAGVGRDTVRKIEAGIRTKEGSRDLVAQALGRTWQAIEAEAADAGAVSGRHPPSSTFADKPAPDVMTAIEAMVRRVEPGVQDRMLEAVAKIYGERREPTGADPSAPGPVPATSGAPSIPRKVAEH